jgi:hypothetical protein
MPPILNKGTPIIVNLDALLPRAAREGIDLKRVKSPPKDAILIDEFDPLVVLLAGRKNRR